MGEIRDEVSNVINALKYTKDQINLLDFKQGELIFKDCLSYFVANGDRRWWWEDFKNESFDFIDFAIPYDQILRIIPDMAKKVWFMIEDIQDPYYPIYDCYPLVIPKILEQCVGFEYYIIDKNKEWLICENHHNRLIGIGEILKIKNKDLVKK
jgi:hypothetical protein